MRFLKLTPQMQLYVKNGGLLYNPTNGRTFKSNIHNVRRIDLQQVSGPTPDESEMKPIISTAEDGTAAVLPGEEVHIGGKDASDALDEVLGRLASASKKSELRNIGTELGLTLDKKITNNKMREMIQEHVEKLKTFDI